VSEKAMESLQAAAMVDLARYPIDALEGPAGASFAAEGRRQFEDSGLCLLPGFIRPPALELLAGEANVLCDRAYFCNSSHNAYLTPDDDSLPDDHPARRLEETYVGSLPYDRLPRDSALRRLYQWDPLKDFIGAVLGKPKLYRFADPLGACSINVFRDGGAHGWHFDESEFTVTLMLQAPEAGGAFEYLPGIRGRADEAEIVARALDGGREGVVELPFTPGTLLIFGGQKTLHRVTRVLGERPRLVPVLCYSVEPDLKNSEAVRKLFWGRSGSEATA
jgi:hypothetical protein